MKPRYAKLLFCRAKAITVWRAVGSRPDFEHWGTIPRPVLSELEANIVEHEPRIPVYPNIDAVKKMSDPVSAAVVASVRIFREILFWLLR